MKLLPCGHARCDASTCHVRRLFETDPRFARLWDAYDGTPQIQQPPQRRRMKLDCVHLGEETGGRNPRWRYRACERGHGPQCGCEPASRCGRHCPDYQPPPPAADLQ